MLEREEDRLTFVFIGLTISSSWGNGHATTYRGLIRELGYRGHRVHFLERDQPWYRENRDGPSPEGCTLTYYDTLEELFGKYGNLVSDADVLIVGSYVPDGVAVAEWALEHARGITAFYDIDTPVTLAKLARGDHEYLAPSLVPRFDLYLSFTGGPTLDRIQEVLGSPCARHLPCSVDASRYRPVDVRRRWDLGFLGTYSPDRQPSLDRLLLEPARRLPKHRFIVGGPSYPDTKSWPRNVKHITHVNPREHPSFYCGQRATLNVTRADMIAAGFSPSVRLFEAAACGVPILSDRWEGIERYFEPEREILLVESTEDVERILREMSEADMRAMGRRARERALREHTSAARATDLLSFVRDRMGLARAAE